MRVFFFAAKIKTVSLETIFRNERNNEHQTGIFKTHCVPDERISVIFEPMGAHIETFPAYIKTAGPTFETYAGHIETIG